MINQTWLVILFLKKTVKHKRHSWAANNTCDNTKENWKKETKKKKKSGSNYSIARSLNSQTLKTTSSAEPLAHRAQDKYLNRGLILWWRRSRVPLASRPSRPCPAHVKRSPAFSFTLWRLLRASVTNAHSQHRHWQARSQSAGTRLTRKPTRAHTHTQACANVQSAAKSTLHDMEGLRRLSAAPLTHLGEAEAYWQVAPGSCCRIFGGSPLGFVLFFFLLPRGSLGRFLQSSARSLLLRSHPLICRLYGIIL